MPSRGRTALYRLFDAENNLLYVGIATNPHQRWQLHSSNKPWWGEVAMREVEWLATRDLAELAEATAIAEEGPRYNKNAGRPAERGPSGSYWRPDDTFRALVQHFTRTDAAAVAVRTELEQRVVREFKAGASANAIAAHCPWTAKAIYALAKSAGVPKLRKSTVVALRPRVWETPTD